MSNIIDKITNFIKDNFILSLATIDDDQPYACNLFYATSEGINLYFSSMNNSQHIQNINKNQNLAGAIYKHNSLEGYESSKIGTQFIGTSKRVSDKIELLETLNLYGNKFAEAKDWANDLADFLGDEHGIYKITINKAKYFNTIEKIELREYIDI